MSDKQQLTGRNCNEHLYRVYALKENYVIKDLNAKDKKELTSPGVLVQAKDTDGVLLTYNDLVNSSDLRRELTGLGPKHFQNLRLERLGKYELIAVEQNRMIEKLKDEGAIIDMHKLEDQTLNTFFFKDKEELVAHLTGKKLLRQYERKTGKEVIPKEHANIPCMFDREIVIVQDGYSLGFINPLDVNDKTLPCPVVGYFEAFKEEITIKDKKTGKLKTVEVSKEDNSGRVVFCHCATHGHTETIIITGKNHRYSSGEIIIGKAIGIVPNTPEIRIPVTAMDLKDLTADTTQITLKVNDVEVTAPITFDKTTNEIVIDTTTAGIGFDTKVEIAIKEGTFSGISDLGETVVNDEKVITITTEKEVILVEPELVSTVVNNLTPNVIRPNDAFEFDIEIKVAENDGTSNSLKVSYQGTQLDIKTTVVDGLNIAHISMPAGVAIAGKATFDVEYEYEFKGVTKTATKSVEVLIEANLVVSILNSAVIDNLNPHSVKVDTAFTFDFECNVTKNDGTDLKLEIIDVETGAIIATENHVVEGLNKIACNHAGFATDGNKNFEAKLSFKLDGVVSTDSKQDSVLISDLVAPLFNSAVKSNEPAVIKVGQAFTFDITADITLNDATDAVIKVLNEDSSVLETLNPAVDGVNNILAINHPGFAAAGNKTLKVVFEYKLGKVAGNLNKTINFVVDSLVDATMTSVIGNLDPATVKAQIPFTFDVIATVAKNDADLTKIEVLDGTKVVGTLNSIANGANVISCSHTGFATAGSKSLTVRLTYDLGTAKAKVINNTVSVTVTSLVDVTMASKIENIVPAIIKEKTPFTFDIISTVTKNDGVLTKIEVLDGQTVLGSTTSVVDGVNKISCSHNGITGTGAKLLNIVLTYDLGTTVGKTINNTVNVSVNALVQPEIRVEMKNLTPATVKVGQIFSFDAEAFITPNDGTNLKLELTETDKTVLGTINSVRLGTNTIHCADHAAFATSGLKTFVLKLYYTFGGINTSVEKYITMTVADLVDPVLKTVVVSNLTPATVKVGQACAFDIDCGIVENDGVLTAIEAELDGAKIGNLTSVVNGTNKVKCSMPAQTTAGSKTVNVTLKYTLNGVAKTLARTVNITVADLVEPTLSIAMKDLTPTNPQDGATVTYNMDCTVAKNDAVILTSLVVEDDSTALVGTETFTKANVVDGLNTIACTPTATKTANTYTVKVTLNYTINGTNKTLVKTLTYEVKAKTLATAGYHGKVLITQFGSQAEGGAQESTVVVKYVTADVIKKYCTSEDPFTGLTEVRQAGGNSSLVYAWPVHMGYKYEITDAINNSLKGVTGTISDFTLDIDGTPYEGFCTCMVGGADFKVYITKA